MDKWCLITGGSKGIGYEFAKLFADSGYNLILVARSADRLNHIKEELETRKEIEVLPIPIDLLKPDSINKLDRALEKRDIEIDVLINDAGFGGYGEFNNDNINRDMDIIHLNINVVTEMTYLFLNKMLKRGSGKILNIASIAAFMPGPLSAVYYAAKSYVLNFSLAVAEEIRGSGVSISVLCPGPTKTDFITTASMEKSKIMRWVIMPASRVAIIGFRGLMKGNMLIIPGFLNKLMVLGSRLSPLKIVIRVVKFFMLP